MFVIVVYDAGVKRDPKVLKVCRRYLSWVQRSVFEGELSDAKLRLLKEELSAVLDPHKDSVILYLFQSLRYSRRETLGQASDPNGVIL
ncbi:MAG: CRISPR-associated endonuclease Cas2 [Firmicutes bacterium]|nr:CRISPR-associated endonuclease Cas2 [Bacillota bacterium]